MPVTIKHISSADIPLIPYTACIACFDSRMDETGWPIA